MSGCWSASGAQLPIDARGFIAGSAAASGLDRSRPAWFARAPGRLDLLGGIADYSGSLCLEWPLAEAACAAVQLADDGLVTACSHAPGPLRQLSLPVAMVDDAEALRQATAAEDRIWARYLLGPLAMLAEQRQVRWPGARIVLDSQVPEGAGVSSSAAVGVACLVAAAAAAGLALDGGAIAHLAQRSEHRVAGAPCGIMDQCTVAFGRAGELLRLRCQPDVVEGHLPLPPGIAAWGIDSGQRHAVSGADYGAVRTACAMGAVLLAHHAGARLTSAGSGRLIIEHAPWGEYLVNLPPSRLDSSLLPEHLRGADFLTTYGGVADGLARIDPDRDYAVRAATAHPIHEHHRVRLAAELLSRPRLGSEAAALLGELLFQSHASYGACGLGASGPDALVSAVRAAIANGAPLIGAKITGGGSGGTVAVLGCDDPASAQAVSAIAADYRQRTGVGGRVFADSSPGAIAVGARQLTWKD
ncbi:hypothetical protein LBMAG53_05760 [Planctomycetota bacterium]|nr:hypothetical protein LBMAG53_05760 [Planctomycetota bacterium]